VKFLCDRCKTRYSIGDDRVRGKILKIRCKNCGNVITVREGMAPEPEAEHAVRPKKSTTGAPDVMDERIADRGAPGGARAGWEASRAGHEPQIAANRGGHEPVAANRGGEPHAAAHRAGKEASPAVAGAAGATATRGATGAAPTAAATRGATGAAQTAARGATGAAQTGAAARGAQVDTVRGIGASSARGAQHESVNALNAAFASAMAQPPPAALEEEWYVSIDGEQAGPYSLAEAQRWVGQQPFDAELHCWSEGFDDWLPVDKVSHFRGLRKRPAAPPPLPRVPGAAPRPGLVAPQPPEETPKPLFAATMASLERSVPGISVPPSAAAPARATPPRGTPIAPRGGASAGPGNGAAADARSELKLDARSGAGAAAGPDAGSGARADARSGAKAGAPRDAKPGAKSDPKAAAKRDAGSPAARPAFGDPFDATEGGDAATQLDAVSFGGVDALRAPSAGASASDAGRTAPHLPASSTLPGTGASTAATAPPATDFGSDDDLHIGEVSRVVSLGDIARSQSTSVPVMRGGPASPAVGRSTGLNPSFRTTGAAPSLRGTGAVPSFRTNGAPASEGDAVGGDPSPTMAPIAHVHRRGLIALLVVAIVLVVGVIGAVVLFVTNDGDSSGGSLGTVQNIDTSRPEDPITHRPIGSTPAPTPVVPRATPHPRPPPPTGGSSQIAEPPAPTGGLASDEIEDAARKHQEMTQRCYMRSQRGADAILIGEVKKIAVTLTIDRDGNVSELQLSDHATDNLGKCLSGAIKAWKFRQSAGGTYRFSLNFVNG